MKNNIEDKSVRLREQISIFTKDSFVFFFTDFIRNHPLREMGTFGKKMKSKLKDSLYLIALRLSSDHIGKLELVLSDKCLKILEVAVDLLNEILREYLDHNNYPDFIDGMEERIKVVIHEATFRTYFQNGKLNYREQELNHARRMFRPHKKKIQDRLGISLNDLVSICEFSEELFHKKWNDSHEFLHNKEFQEIAPLLADGSIKGEAFEELLSKLPDSFFDFVEGPHFSSTFQPSDFYERFLKTDIDIFCSLFAMELDEVNDFLFYSQKNPLEDKPIIKISKKEYIHVYQKQLPTALYNLLYRTLGKTESERNKLNLRRGKVVIENQVFNLFKSFFKKSKEYRFFQNYYIDGIHNEKDLLIISRYYAFVIECKASKMREPLRDMDKAYNRIKDDFNACIQKGYNQCREVESICWESNKIEIVNDNGRNKVEVKTDKLIDVFSIVVTLERFGPIQTNLGYLLKRDIESDPYPWSVCLDDLETFLRSLMLLKNNRVREFINFLTLREDLNEKLLAQDELDVCAMYLERRNQFESVASQHDFILTDPALQNFFDKLYFDKRLKFPQESV